MSYIRNTRYNELLFSRYTRCTSLLDHLFKSEFYDVLRYNGKTNQLLPLPQIVIFITTMAGVGISEEFIFKGTILNLLIDKFDKTPKGIYASIIISSIIFETAHITNIFSGASAKSAFIQAVVATVLGALLATIYLRTRNIWVVVILHAFMDFSCLIGSGFFGINSIISEINSYSYQRKCEVKIICMRNTDK